MNVKEACKYLAKYLKISAKEIIISTSVYETDVADMEEIGDAENIIGFFKLGIVMPFRIQHYFIGFNDTTVYIIGGTKILTKLKRKQLCQQDAIL